MWLLQEVAAEAVSAGDIAAITAADSMNVHRVSSEKNSAYVNARSTDTPEK